MTFYLPQSEYLLVAKANPQCLLHPDQCLFKGWREGDVPHLHMCSPTAGWEDGSSCESLGANDSGPSFCNAAESVCEEPGHCAGRAPHRCPEGMELCPAVEDKALRGDSWGRGECAEYSVLEGGLKSEAQGYITPATHRHRPRRHVDLWRWTLH